MVVATSASASQRPASGTPLTRIVAPQGAPPKAQVAVATCIRASQRPHFGTAHHEDRGRIGSSTEGPSGCGHTRLRLSSPILAHPSCDSWPRRKPKWRCSHAHAPLISAHPSRGSWSHREHHRKPKWACSHASAPPISARQSHASWPHKECHPKPKWLWPHASLLLTPLTRIVAPHFPRPVLPILPAPSSAGSHEARPVIQLIGWSSQTICRPSSARPAPRPLRDAMPMRGEPNPTLPVACSSHP